MKLATVIIFLSLGISQATIASPLILKCRINNTAMNINVDHLSGMGCHNQVMPYLVGVMKNQISITVCDGNRAEGQIETLDYQNQWVKIADISTEKSCYLYRNIETDYKCPVGRQRSSDCHNQK